MNKSQENGITILLGLKGYKVEKVSEGTEEIVVEVKANPRGNQISPLRLDEVVPAWLVSGKESAPQLERGKEDLPQASSSPLAMSGV